MSKTKSNKPPLRHCEVKIRTMTQDTADFISYILENKHYKLKNPLNLIFRLAVTAVLYFIACATSIAINELGISEGFRIAFSLVTGIGIVNLFIRMKPRYRNINIEELMKSLAESTAPFDGEKERTVCYSFGEEGFSADFLKDEYNIFFQKYKDLARAVEFEKGIVMIYQDSLNGNFIYCVPARFLDDESACFITERLRKRMGRRFKTEGKMKIGEM